MHKEGFSKHIARQHNITQKASHDVIDTFTSSVIDAMTEGNEISLVGFGNFGINKIAARKGRNPRTGLAVRHVARQEIISLAS